jgi:hypothetical protein
VKPSTDTGERSAGLDPKKAPVRRQFSNALDPKNDPNLQGSK